MNIEVNVALRKNQPLEVKKMVERKRKRKNFDVFQKTMWFVSNRILLQFRNGHFSFPFPSFQSFDFCTAQMFSKKYIEKKDYIFYSVEIFF